MSDAPMQIVLNDHGACVGFLIRRGVQGVELFDAAETSLELFETAAAAVAVSLRRAQP